MKHNTEKGDDNCQHNFVKQDKKTLQILKRVCVKCGRQDVICEDDSMDSETAKRIMKVN